MKEWKKKIKDSAEDIQIPDSLKPENLHVILEKKGKKRDRVFYRKTTALAGLAAAAVLVVMTGVRNIGRSGAMAMAYDTAGTETAQNQSVVDDREAKAVLTETESLYKEKQEIGEFYHTSTYRDIRDQVEKAWEEEAARDAQRSVEENIADGAVEEEVKMEAADTETASGAGEMAGDFSTTNLQVEGVDEGDVVKTDGMYLYILGSDSSVRIVEAENLKEVAKISSGQAGADITYKEMYVDKKRLILAGDRYESRLEETAEDSYWINTSSESVLVTYDLTDITKPRRLGMIQQDGSYRTSRKVGDYVYLFSDYHCRPYEDEIIPRVNGEEMAEGDIFLPRKIERCQYLVMSAVDLKKPNQVKNQKSLLDGQRGGGQFYITKEHIYVIQTDWSHEQPYTNLIRFLFENGEIEGDAAATLKGELTDTFSINEYDGYLRAVLTDRSASEPINRVYVVDEEMQICGMIDDIAPGETIYSARFMGESGYFVTYRNMDPLFSVDFSDPENPEILDELKVSGFSDYLHFYGKDKLLGIGWETDPENGERLGMKLSMYDIQDPKKICEEKKLVLKEVVDCGGLYNYKMILADAKKNLIGFPAYVSDGESGYEVYLVFFYDPEKGFQKELEYPLSGGNFYNSGEYTRGVYIGERFYVTEEKKITVFDRKNGFEETGSLELAKKR